MPRVYQLSHQVHLLHRAKHRIFFLGETPTTHQEMAFPDYADIRKAILKDVGKVDKATRTELVNNFRAYKDVGQMPRVIKVKQIFLVLSQRFHVL